MESTKEIFQGVLVSLVHRVLMGRKGRGSLLLCQALCEGLSTFASHLNGTFCPRRHKLIGGEPRTEHGSPTDHIFHCPLAILFYCLSHFIGEIKKE